MHPLRKLDAGNLYVTMLGSTERRWTRGASSVEFHVTLSRDAAVNRLQLITLRFSDASVKLHEDTLRTGEMPQMLCASFANNPTTTNVMSVG